MTEEYEHIFKQIVIDFVPRCSQIFLPSLSAYVVPPIKMDSISLSMDLDSPVICSDSQTMLEMIFCQL